MTLPTSLSALIRLRSFAILSNLHAIANALSLALGIDPTEISYDERAMREHLFNCLEEEFLTMFPHSFRSSVHKKGVKKKSILLFMQKTGKWILLRMHRVQDLVSSRMSKHAELMTKPYQKQCVHQWDGLSALATS